MRACVCVCVFAQVRIDQTHKARYRDTLLGVVINSPESFTLPSYFKGPDPAVLCIVYDGSYVFGIKVKIQLFNVLRFNLLCCFVWATAFCVCKTISSW